MDFPKFIVSNQKGESISIQRVKLADFFQALKELDENIAKFNKNYMLLNDYLEDAGDRLNHISTSATEVKTWTIFGL